MPKSLVYNRDRPAGDVSFNMTPLIDCTFLLIVFFILASQMASSALSQLQLHRPVRSQAIVPASPPERVIVNIISIDESVTSTRASHYEIDGVAISLDRVDLLTHELNRRLIRAGEAEFFVEIRADSRVWYGDVFPVMSAATDAGISRMNITALVEVGR